MKKRLSSRKHKAFGLATILLLGLFLFLIGGYWMFSRKFKISIQPKEQVNTQPIAQKPTPPAEVIPTQPVPPQAPAPEPISVPPAPQSEILIGTMIGLTGQFTDVQKEVLDEMQFLINATNLQGGIHGEKIKLLFYDHQYTPEIAVKCLKSLIEKKVQIILVPIGTPPLEACLPSIKENDLLVLFPNSAAKSIKTPELRKKIISFRTSYQNEAYVLLDYAVKNSNTQRVAIFYQDDGYGKSCLDGAIDALKDNNISDDQILKVPYTQNSTAVGSEAEKIKNFDPDSIVVFGVPPVVQSLFSKFESFWLLTKKLFGISSVISAAFLDYLKQKSLKCTFSHVLPNPQDTSLEITGKYIEHIKKHNLQHDDYLFFSYIATSLFLDILNQIDKPIIKEKILSKIESLNNYKFKGLTLNFDPQTSELTKNVWIEPPNGEWIFKPFENH